MRLGDSGPGLGARQGAGGDVGAVHKKKVLVEGFHGVNRGVHVSRHLGRSCQLKTFCFSDQTVNKHVQMVLAKKGVIPVMSSKYLEKILIVTGKKIFMFIFIHDHL